MSLGFQEISIGQPIMVIDPLLCCGKLGKDPYFDFPSFSSNNLTKVIMDALTIGGGMLGD
jgi:hypothetical protein